MSGWFFFHCGPPPLEQEAVTVKTDIVWAGLRRSQQNDKFYMPDFLNGDYFEAAL